MLLYSWHVAIQFAPNDSLYHTRYNTRLRTVPILKNDGASEQDDELGHRTNTKHSTAANVVPDLHRQQLTSSDPTNMRKWYNTWYCYGILARPPLCTACAARCSGMPQTSCRSRVRCPLETCGRTEDTPPAARPARFCTILNPFCERIQNRKTLIN